jgi:hypothetical protein
VEHFDSPRTDTWELLDGRLQSQTTEHTIFFQRGQDTDAVAAASSGTVLQLNLPNAHVRVSSHNIYTSLRITAKSIEVTGRVEALESVELYASHVSVTGCSLKAKRVQILQDKSNIT